jgi:hypothetical protein
MTAKDISNTILYAPVTNNKHDESIEKGRLMIEEYAETKAIDFADWITSSGYSISKDRGIWGHDMDFMCEQPKTTAELYEQFKAGGGK